MTYTYDFCIATDWEYDQDFLQMLQKAAHHEQGLTTYFVDPQNLDETIHRINNHELQFNFFYDRGSDTSPEFLVLHNLLVEHGVPLLDSMQRLKWASDKATMHLEFISHGLVTPYTIIIPPFSAAENLYLSVADLARLGRPFIIKPANTTGGGTGVVDGAETLQDVLQARRKYEQDKYLLQEKVTPLEKDDKRFWFRGFYCCGSVECTWWNDITHHYQLLSSNETENYQFAPIYAIVRRISEIIQLHFFSTEIAMNPKGDFVVIDYVNEVCDMRLKSIHFDGVPDEIVQRIADQIVRYVKMQIRPKRNYDPLSMIG